MTFQAISYPANESSSPWENFYAKRRVLVTGHTGFKGAWLSFWLAQLGAEVIGFALPPATDPNLYVELGLAEKMVSILGDMGDFQSLHQVMTTYQPEVVFHLAAQALVRRSYENPVETYATNVLGTVHLLESVRKNPNVRAVVNVTSDKCYENRGWYWGYRENDPLGGEDPYSNSKACAELVTQAYRASFYQTSLAPRVATVRAGNVIGGGDWAADRLVPDCIRAFQKQEKVTIRYPHAVRPWQHVLEPLAGYMTLGYRLATASQELVSPLVGAFNFGPNESDAQSVAWMVEKICQQWGGDASWTHENHPQPSEAHLLRLDAAKARELLGWHSLWSLTTALEKTVAWYQSHLAGGDVQLLTRTQINDYQKSLSGI